MVMHPCHCRNAATVLLACLALVEQAAADRPLWLVVGRPGLVEAIEPLATHRRRQGFDVVVSTDSVDAAITESPRMPDFLLLVGDDGPGAEGEAWYLPSRRLGLYRWRASQAYEYASDAAWSPLDASGVPRIAIGRIPARSREQVALVVRKTIAYEEPPPRLEDLRLLAWCGSPGYGAVDRMAAGLLQATVRTHAPVWLEPWMIAADPACSLCGWPSDQPRLFSRELRSGGVLAVLMGHGSIGHFFSMEADGLWIGYTAEEAEALLGDGPPVMPIVLFACDCGNFTEQTPCLAESLLFLAGGPVVTIAATTESHPLTNYFSGVALLRALDGGPKRMGEVWLASQREGRRMRNLMMELLLRDVEGKLEPDIDTEKLRRDQPLMYVLLGDPAVRLRLPEKLKATVERTASNLRWSVEPIAGARRLDIGLRTSQPAKLAPLTARPGHDEALQLFEKAQTQFRFSPLDAKPADELWTDELTKSGTLRLVASGSGTLRVCAIEAASERSTTASAPAQR